VANPVEAPAKPGPPVFPTVKNPSRDRHASFRCLNDEKEAYKIVGKSENSGETLDTAGRCDI